MINRTVYAPVVKEQCLKQKYVFQMKYFFLAYFALVTCRLWTKGLNGDKMNLTTNTSTNTNAQHSGSACAMTCNQCTCITNKLPFLAQRGSLWQQDFSVHICPYNVVVAVSTHLPSRILRICGDTSNPGPDQHHGCTRRKRYP